jgi:hypothetical protein
LCFGPLAFAGKKKTKKTDSPEISMKTFSWSLAISLRWFVLPLSLSFIRVNSVSVAYAFDAEHPAGMLDHLRCWPLFIRQRQMPSLAISLVWLVLLVT